MDQKNRENKSINSNLAITIDKLIKTYKKTDNTNSPSPPLLLLQTGTEDIKESKLDSKEEFRNNSSSFEKPLALIQTNDLNEMNSVLNSLKNNFPNINIHLCLNNINEENIIYKDDKKLSPKPFSSNNLKNSLTASYLSNKFKCGDRASSVDNSSLSTTIERQESKDSGFWSINKCSFESTKSLSISDSHSNDSTMNGSNSAQTSHLLPVQNQHKSALNTNEEKSCNNNNNNNNNINSNNNQSNFNNIINNNSNENDFSRQYLSSPTGFSKSPLYNWKKWKKGQAWRYNSNSSNFSQSDCSTNNEEINTRNNSLNYTSFESNSINLNQIDNESNNDGASIPNLSQTHTNSNFSNSFELSFSSSGNPKLTPQSSNLSNHLWSSTSKLDQLNNPNIKGISFDSSINSVTNINHKSLINTEPNHLTKAQKRRGKLMRDRTIDNTDEQHSISSFNNLSLNNSLTNNNVKLENTRFDSISSLISPLSISTKEQNTNSNSNINNTTNPFLSSNGRVSPPEKRVTLNNNNININANILNDLDQSQSQNINLLRSHYLNNKILSNETQVHNNYGLNSIAANTYTGSKNSASSSLSSSPIPQSTSIHNVMNSAAVAAAAAAFAAAISNPNSSNNISQSNNIENICLLNKYDFYKDLQAKLNIKANESEEILKNSPKYHSSSSIYKPNLNNNKSSSPSPDLSNSNLSNIKIANTNPKQNNFLSNNLKMVSRSNSSPSYSSSESNIPLQVQYSSPSLFLYQPSVTTMIQTNSTDNSKMSIFSSISSFNGSTSLGNKSSSTCSLSLANYSQFNSNNFNICNPKEDFNSNNLTANIMNKNQVFFNNTNKLSNPPEIVITESKTEQEQIDYEHVDNSNKYNSNFINYKLNQENQNFQNLKQDNNFSKVNIFSPLQQNQQYNTKYSNGSNNHFDNSLKKDQDQINNQTINTFENWKNVNSLMKFTTNNTNNTNNDNINKISNNTLNLIHKTSVISPSTVKQCKPHVCPNCQKRFARSDMLIRHSRLHSGVRPYRCNRCGQEFSRSDHLNTHLRTHTGEKPYSCPHPKCTYAACRKDMITRHLKVHTKNRMSLSFDNTGNNNSADNNLKTNQLLSEPTSKLLQYPSISFESTSINLKYENKNKVD